MDKLGLVICHNLCNFVLLSISVSNGDQALKPSCTVKNDSWNSISVDLHRTKIACKKDMLDSNSRKISKLKPQINETSDLMSFEIKDCKKNSFLLQVNKRKLYALTIRLQNKNLDRPAQLYCRIPNNKRFAVQIWLVRTKSLAETDSCQRRKLARQIDTSEQVPERSARSFVHRNSGDETRKCLCHSSVEVTPKAVNSTLNITVKMTNIPTSAFVTVILDSKQGNNYSIISKLQGDSQSATVTRYTRTGELQPGMYEVWCNITCTPSSVVSCDPPLARSGFVNIPKLSASAEVDNLLRSHPVPLRLSDDGRPTSIDVTVVAVVVVSGLLGLWMIICFAIIFYTKCTIPRKRTVHSSQTDVKQFCPDQDRSKTGSVDTIAIIYPEDSQEYIKAVEAFAELLNEGNIHPELINIENHGRMRENWLDFAEDMLKIYSKFLFVLSPALYHMCHDRKYSTDNNPVSYNHANHFLPVTLLHLLRLKSFENTDRCVRTFVVSLCPLDTNMWMDRFIKDHPVLNNGFQYSLVSATEENHKVDIVVEAISALCRHIKVESYQTRTTEMSTTLYKGKKAKTFLRECQILYDILHQRMLSERRSECVSCV